MQTWDINPNTGDYKIDAKGKPIETNSLLVPAYIRLKTRRNSWMYAPNKDFGSDFHLIKKRKTTSDASQIENTAVRALDPIVQDDRAKTIDIQPVQLARHGVSLSITVTDNRGEEQQLIFTPVGG